MVNSVELLMQVPSQVSENGRGALHIPIVQLEDQLDLFRFSTKDYKWELYKDESGNMCVAASIVVAIWVSYKVDDEEPVYPSFIERSFVGACNFSLLSIAPIPDWNATAKSMCIKNAATDIGKWFGRGLNAEILADQEAAKVVHPVPKVRPGKKVQLQYEKAVLDGDQTTINLLTSIYDFNA